MSVQVFNAQHSDSNDKPYVDGPINGCGYYGGTLWPSSRFETFERAQAAAELLNRAFEAGKMEARREIRLALGMR